MKGSEFDWNNLYGGNKPNRISAPTYPFARERYWVDTTDGPTKSNTQMPGLSKQTENSPTTRANGKASNLLPVADKISFFLKQELARHLQVSIDNIDVEESFFDLGADSLCITNLIGKTNHLLQENIIPSVIFEHTTIRKFTDYLVTTFSQKAEALVFDNQQHNNIVVF
ncbi:MAG: hypothetical protein HC896_00785 [Bacteroidales bacterium]|nr:hypothetical protein [Bacteroidales bacterium]